MAPFARLQSSRAFRETAANYQTAPRAVSLPSPVAELRRGSVKRLAFQIGRHPHLLEIVEFAHLGPEHMDDHVARVDQHPVGAFQTFDARGAVAGILERLEQMV